MRKSFILITLLSLFAATIHSQVLINEYSCSNLKRTVMAPDTIWYDTTWVDTNWVDTSWIEFNGKSKNWEQTISGEIKKVIVDTIIDEDPDTFYVYFTSKDDCNCRYIRDNYGKTEDWIELYNNSDKPVNISGCYLSDNKNKLTKFKIPQTSPIPAKGFKVIFADGRGLIKDDTIHTNFKFTQTKDDNEYICFSDATGKLVDSVKIKKTKGCYSRGRLTDGKNEWGIFPLSTAGKSNNVEKSFKSFSSKPDFDKPAGVYASPVTITITTQQPLTETIHYTLDGTEPNKNSPIYTQPITIDTTSVLKAVCINNDTSILPGFVEFATYLINEHHTLPIVSISASTLDSLANGIKEYRPWGSIEYFDVSGERKGNSYGEFNSHGQDSWVNDQRSIDFVARDEMGYSNGIKEKLFGLSKREKFQRIILRAAGDDNYPAATNGIPNESNKGSAHLRDAYFQNLCKQGGLKLDTRTGSKCIVYINGKYWGVYDIRELPDDNDYTEYYYKQGKYDIQYILTWGGTWAEYGGEKALEDWGKLRNYIFNNDMSVQKNYDYVTEQLDVTSLVDYVISHSISVSSDWLNYNTGWWRGLNPDGGHKKWGYILWDNDASFAFYINYTGIPDTSASAAFCNVDNPEYYYSDPEQHLKVLKKLRENPKFNQFYISRYIDLVNTTFSCENMLHQLDSLEQLIEPEMSRHIERWPGGSFEGWKNNVARLRYFVERRCGARAQNKLDSCYNLTGPYDVVFDVYPKESGKVKINSLQVNQLPWNATYFGNIGINIEGLPNTASNYRFDYWNSEMNQPFEKPSKTNNNSIKIGRNDSITANMTTSPNDIDKPENKKCSLTISPTLVNDFATISFYTAKTQPVSMKLYTLSGVQLADIVPGNKNYNQGKHTLSIDFKKLNLANGTYIIRYKNESQDEYVKFIIIP